MESTSDGMFDPGISFSSMKQPPLIKQLKGILSEYPDGGQILKELLQNAEDADATEVNILYDGRNINDQYSGSAANYNKFFKGPALCVSNNAIFTDEDWEGIRMIYSSVKEDDPLKVGRFGLGFKSVFHITDFPCVISGDKLLMIDPQQSSDRVNAMVNLCKVGSLEKHGLNAEAFWAAFDGTFEINKKSVKKGYYAGTLFWFPLRQKASDLSETLYDEAKVMDLFDGFRSEVSSILLFLKNLEKITVCTRGKNGLISEIAKVEIKDQQGVVRKDRLAFKEKVRRTGSNYKGKDIQNVLQISMSTTTNGQCLISDWMVVNYFVGKSADPSFRKLIQDESLGYSPYVGVAAPLLPSSDKFEGHVFCFLPLPREGSRLTGLPVHVNGFFALSQNRHHLKWETDEQRGRKIHDKSILWNKYLVAHALPVAYHILLNALWQRTVACGNTPEMLDHFYSCVPLSSDTQTKWQALETEVYARLVPSPFLYSSYTNRWVSLTDACFATFRCLPHDHAHVRDAVKRCLTKIGKNYVEIPSELFDTLRRHYPQITDLSPELLMTYLHQSNDYRTLSDQDKLDILEYILSDRNYMKLNGLELLPLYSGGWTCFSKYGETIYSCSEDMLKILPGHENILLKDATSLRRTLVNHFSQICSTGVSQIKVMEVSTFTELLNSTMRREFGTTKCWTLTKSKSLTIKWLHDVWCYIIREGNISSFTSLKIVPDLKKGTWKKPQIIDLTTLSDRLLVRSSNGDTLPDEVCRCFEIMGVTILESLPSWIPKEIILRYCFWPTPKSVVELFSAIGSSRDAYQIVAAFNKTCKWNDRVVLRTQLEKCQFEITEEAKRFVRELKIFHAVRNMKAAGDASSVHEVPRFISGTEQFPKSVPLPFICLLVDGSFKSLVVTLGGKKVHVEELVIESLRRFHTGKKQDIKEMKLFMTYFIKKFHLFKNNSVIVQCAQTLHFLNTSYDSHRYKPSELFDPTDPLLLDLLLGESLVPDSTYAQTDENIRVLRDLGLQGLDDIDCNILHKVARTLDRWTREEKQESNLVRKANAFMKVMSSKPSLLHDLCQHGSTLADSIYNLSCIPVQSRLPSYPAYLHWFSKHLVVCKASDAKDVRLCFLIGAIIPTVTCSSEHTKKIFQWESPPPVSKILDQLKMIRTYYTVQHKSETVPVIKAIYDHLNERKNEIIQQKHLFEEEEVIWAGEEFVKANQMIADKQTFDLDLCPYFFSLPEEYRYIQDLFVTLGCPFQQDVDILQETLHRIRTTHDMHQSEKNVKRDRRIVCDILDRIAKMVLDEIVHVDDLDVLMMVHDVDHPSALKLCPVAECTYDDDPACFYDESTDVFLVHRMIPIDIAETLGVKSITRKAALDAEEFGAEEWGQKEHLTTRIHALLRDGYTDGLSVPKELIQNADDAGATKVKFLYDERSNLELRERVLSKGMKNFQGPALWVFNDAKFSDQDLKNITKLNAATKQTDVKKIGKFGLGFCSVYNLTDLPSFITGSSVVFFDPHEKHLGSVLRKRGTGLKYTLPNRNLVSRHIDQFKPYNGVFNCNVGDDTFTEYEGTLFRLPLRTEQQARESEIYSVSYTREEMINLLRMFIRAAGNMLLFSQNVVSIEIYHLKDNATAVSEQDLLFNLHKTSLRWDNNIMRPITESVLSRIPLLMQRKESFLEIHKTNIHQVIRRTCKELIRGLDNRSESLDTTWLTSWAKGKGRSLKMSKSMSAEGAVPLAAVAVPCKDTLSGTPVDLKEAGCGFYNEGHVFCFLPLPLKTELPVHVNGCFAVTSDRRQLVSITEDDKGSNRNVWNNALLEDALVISFVHLLETLTENDMKVDQGYNAYALWPSNCSREVLPFKNAFYRHIIVTDAKVFYGCSSWVSFQKTVFLDPNLRQQACGDLAFEVMTRFTPRKGKTLVEMPGHIYKNIIQSNRDNIDLVHSAIISEKEFLLIFLRNIEDPFWANRVDDRNTLIALAIKVSDNDVRKTMQNMRCIPTEPHQKMCKPADLIHPNSSVAGLFSVYDERFPINTKEFRSKIVLKKLVELGMIDRTLPSNLLVDRSESIPHLASYCCSCSRERCITLIEYLSNNADLSKLETETETLNGIRNVCMFPVMLKPKSWAFTWGADSDDRSFLRFDGRKHCKNHSYLNYPLVLGQSKALVRQQLLDYVGSLACLVDKSVISTVRTRRNDVQRLFILLGVQSLDDLPLQMLVDHLCLIAREYQDKSLQFEELRRIYNTLFTRFDNIVKTERENIPECLNDLRDVPVILIGTDLVRAENVAFWVREEYKPLLNRLPDADKMKWKNIYKYLGVNEDFSVSFILKQMTVLRENWQAEKTYLEKIHLLLVNLKDVMDRHKIQYEDLHDFHDAIIAPDSQSRLWPTHEMAAENVDFDSNIEMKILHRDIPISLGESLGVKTKELKCWEKMSIGVSFGQREKLVTRIKGLLKAYPCDESIMKELLQNADDAGATEIHFVKDYRNHSTKRLFSRSCKPLQGPALCVYNNSYFTKDDIEGIHNLGQGSKSDDPAKTGQYGVGFNAVYHLSDTPAFITKGPGGDANNYLIILDPLCKYVPKANTNEPGQMCKLADVEKNFPEHLLGFSQDKLITGEAGTVFRFPLRSEKSDIGDIIKTNKMDSILNSFRQEMNEAVLFLKNVTSIKVSRIDCRSGDVIEEYSVNVQLSEEVRGKKERFNDIVVKAAKMNKDNRDKNLDVGPHEVLYPIKVTDSYDRSAEWLIVKQFGHKWCTGNTEDIKIRLKDGDLGLLPIGGVAIPLNSNHREKERKTGTDVLETSNKFARIYHWFSSSLNTTQSSSEQAVIEYVGKAFCFLPLPVNTGLPVHINGHFALDHEARRDLWKDGYRMNWNLFILESVIIPSWITGVLYMRNSVEEDIKNTSAWFKIEEVMKVYHSLFPLHDLATSDIWKKVVSLFYTQVVKHNIDLFPYVLESERETQHLETGAKSKIFHVHWTHVTASSNLGTGVFNVISDYFSYERYHSRKKKSSHLVGNLLKSFGMKLLETPVSVVSELKTAGWNDIQVSTPSLVISYMRSSSCDVGQVNVDISSSKFRSTENLSLFVIFIIHDTNFAEKILNLPILLTGDGMLRIFSEDYPVFVTNFSRLLPASSCKFVHDAVYRMFLNERCFQTNACKKFEFRDFISLLPYSMQRNVFASESEIHLNENENEDNSHSISQKWLCLFYDFLCDQSQNESDTSDSQNESDSSDSVQIPQGTNRKAVDTKKFRSSLMMLQEWSFLPCLNRNKHFLIPIREAPHLIYLSYRQRQDILGKALQKLCLPTLYLNALNDCQFSTTIMSSMPQCVASLESPSAILQCLVYHKDKIRHCEALTIDEGMEIIAYFGRELPVLRSDTDGQMISFNLRQLPLFLTLQGTLTSIENNQEVLVIPKGMPSEGIQEWGDSCRMILLQERDSLGVLCEILGLETADVEYVYGEKILPHFAKMPHRYWIYHIVYLRNILGIQPLNTPSRAKILQELKNIAFINVSGTMKRVNQLFDPLNEVFQCMKDNSDFPPREFVATEWRYFLKQLGLITDVTDEMLIQFACKIESEGQQGTNEYVREKSSVLLYRFLENGGRDWRIPTLERIKSVKFITPYEIDRQKAEIWPQYSNTGFVCFQDATSCINCSLCWTSLNLIPNRIVGKIDEEVRGSLRIYKSPPVDKVILHCQNVCDALKRNLRLIVIDRYFVQEQMICFYEYFSKYIPMNPQIRQRLQYTPFVHLPDENEIVLTSEIVIDLSTHSQIKPYLYKAPKYYGKYHDLFEMMGSKNKIMFSHYAYILNRIKNICNDEEMNPLERGIAKKTIRELVCHNPETDESTNEVRSVYLPNKDLVLCNSKRIVISNSWRFEYRLSTHANINYFAGISFLELTEKENVDLEKVFSKWPSRLKPKMLKDIVEEIIPLEELGDEESFHSNKAVTIEEFLHSPELPVALMGVLKHQYSKGIATLNFDEAMVESDTIRNLRNISAQEVPSLRTVLKYEGNIISGSELKIAHHIKKEENTIVFYFNDMNETSDLDTVPILRGLIELVQLCTPDLDKESIMHVTSILQAIETPESLPEVLLRLQIEPYQSLATRRDYFPKPGTYVEPRFIPFLEPGIEPFRDYEYDHVAMELEDATSEINESDYTNAVYIYVKIIRECSNTSIGSSDVGRMYIVNTGNSDAYSEQVPIFRLFRFVRRGENTGSELQVYDAEPIHSIPFDEQCRRIRAMLIDAWKLPKVDRKRVVRRLILKWHPDKNRGNEEYCKKVFQYIKIVISRLENEELVTENAESEMSRGPSSFSSASTAYYENVNRRAQTYARAFYENYDSYCRSERTGNYSHYSAQQTPRPDPAEARRWLRQSKNDFKAAEAMLPLAYNVKGFNWICYLCHQSCEKALKAARYSRDANKVPKGSQSHCLTFLTSDTAMRAQAELLETRLSDHARLRYPDAVTRPQIPSDKFNQEDAEFSIGVARKMIELAEDYIS